MKHWSFRLIVWNNGREKRLFKTNNQPSSKIFSRWPLVHLNAFSGFIHITLGQRFFCLPEITFFHSSSFVSQYSLIGSVQQLVTRFTRFAIAACLYSVVFPYYCLVVTSLLEMISGMRSLGLNNEETVLLANIILKANEDVDEHALLLNAKTAFDSIHRSILWSCLPLNIVPKEFILLFQPLSAFSRKRCLGYIDLSPESIMIRCVHRFCPTSQLNWSLIQVINCLTLNIRTTQYLSVKTQIKFGHFMRPEWQCRCLRSLLCLQNAVAGLDGLKDWPYSCIGRNWWDRYVFSAC